MGLGFTAGCYAQRTSRIMEAVRMLKLTQEASEDKRISFNPHSPNGVGKLSGDWIAVKERNCDGMQWRMLQQEQTRHFVSAPYQQDSMRQFMEASAKARTRASSTRQIFKRCFWHAEMGETDCESDKCEGEAELFTDKTPKDVEGRMMAIVSDETRKGSPLRSED